MKRSFNKFGVLGSIATRFKHLRHIACETGTTRKTKRQLKRLASQANRIFIKKLTKLTLEDIEDLI
ncbi:MAG: hypothetical protein ACKO2Z_09760 [Sphaerospermopsis kisseleviana]